MPSSTRRRCWWRQTTCMNIALFTESRILTSLKPENVLIDRAGYIKIADFGLCKRNFLKEEVFSITGTPEYLAPQNLERKPCSESIDWWALGSIIYEMIEGLPPFYAKNREETFRKIKTEEVQMSAKFSLQCQDFIRKLLSKDPSTRLGAQGIKEIKGHPWFDKINWEKLVAKEYKAPYVPQLKSDIDLSHFDEEFLMANVQSFSESLSKEPIKYDDFTYDQRRVE